MTRRNYIAVVLAACLVVAWLLWRPRDLSASRLSPARRDSQPSSLASQLANERSTLADALNSPTTDIRADLRLLSAILDTFRTNFPRNGNPVGNNSEITATLTGRNPLRLSLIPANHPAINPRGELCDRWGTPFFFHAESAAQMGIRSAGPDQRLWTDDDVVLLP